MSKEEKQWGYKTFITPDYIMYSERWENVEKETRDKVELKFDTWSEHQIRWIEKWMEMQNNLADSIHKKYGENEDAIKLIFGIQEDKLILRRGMELIDILLWIQKCLLSGAYHQAIRELRYALEIMVQSYYLDTRHPQASLRCKMEILKELEDLRKYLTGQTIIEKTDLDNKEELKGLYKNLSGFVHPSLKEIQSHNEHFQFEFNEELFNLCVDFSNKVMDAIYNMAEKWITTL